VKIGLNLVPIGARAGGIGRHASELPPALLAADPHLELTVLGSRELPRMAWEDAVRVIRLPFGLAGRIQMAVQLGGLPGLGLLTRLDVLHSIGNVGPPGVPGLPSVITVNDLIWLHAGTDWGPPAAVAAMRRVALRSARWASRVQAPSKATADDLTAIAGVPADRIDLVPIGVSATGARTATEREARGLLGLGDRPVILVVAQKRPYKNLAVAIRAMRAVPEAVLVLPGRATPHECELRRLAARLGLEERVTFVEWVDDPILEALYRMATCVLVPSLFEGFGLPVLEAMARGAPVGCADAGSLPEVAGGAALLFDPHDEEAVGRAVVRILRDQELRTRLAEAGRARAAEFSWGRCAQATLESYERARGTRRRYR